MKTFSLTLLLLGFSLLAFGQAAPMEKEAFQAPASYQKLEWQFVKTELSQQQREDYTLRAGQKIRDLFDLINMMSSPGLDPELRERSKVSALRLFSEADAPVGLPESEKGQVKVLALPASELLESCSSQQAAPQGFNLSELMPQSAWVPRAEGGYSQTWSFLLEYARVGGTWPMTAELLLEQRMKTFGEEQQPVWEVLIKQIEP